MTELALWNRWRTRRDGDAFAALVRGHLAAATDAACRCGGSSMQDAEDAVQEALVRLARTRDDTPVRVGLRAWLIRQARERTRSGVRARRRRAAREAESQPLRRRTDAVPRTDLRDEVEAALAKLSEPEREAVVLRFLHDLDYRDMAHVLGLGEGACRQRVHIAVRRLRSVLGPRASALVAALGLAAPSSEAGMVAAATKASTGVAALTTMGVTAMSSTAKLVVAAAVGGAVAAVGLFGADLVFAPRTSTARAPAREPRRAPPTPRSASLPALVEATPEEIEFLRQTLRAERERRVNARIRPGDSGLDILERVIRHGADVSELLADFDRMASHVRIPGIVVAIDAGPDLVTEVDFVALLEEGPRIRFGPGVFEVQGRLRSEALPVLEITGAGRERTTLIWNREVLVKGDFENVRVADLTLEMPDEEFLDVRGRAAVVLENVRFEGWWPDAGYGAPIGLSGGVYLAARGCEFAGGRSSVGDAGSATALAVRGTAVAGLFDCDFLDTETLTGWAGAARLSHVRLSNCRFANAALSRHLIHQGEPEYDVVVSGGRVRFGTPDLSQDERRRRWGAQFVARLEDVSFEPEPDAAQRGCQWRDVLEAAAATPARDGEILTVVRLLSLASTPRVVFGFYHPDARRERVVIVARGPAGWAELPERKTKRSRVRVPHLRRDQLAGVLGLLDATRIAGVDERGIIREVRYVPRAFDGVWSYAVVVTRAGGRRDDTLHLDGRTGRLIAR